MPYLNDEKKARLQPVLDAMKACGVEDPGEINYLACQAVLIHMATKGMNYFSLSAAIAGVGDAHAELRHRVLDLYEFIRSQTNGDIFKEIADRIKCIG